MADDTSSFSPSRRTEGPGRGPRQGDSRDAGGFRIRLSDNEMQAARALQEAFGLRSTVAVLGFALRTLAQQLEAGQLDELVAQQRAQGRERSHDSRGEERRAPREGQRGGGGEGRPARANPFARPSKPVVAPPAESEAEPAAVADSAAALDADPGEALAPEAAAAESAVADAGSTAAAEPEAAPSDAAASEEPESAPAP
jgi:hypothetical protein